MKNTVKGFKQQKQCTQLYQGTRGFFYGTQVGFIWYTQKVVISSINERHVHRNMPKQERGIVSLSA